MALPLLTTKLYIPPPHPNLVRRPRLTAQVDEGLRLGRKLTLVSAPAGCGKTTLLGEWIAGGGGRAIAWLSLDEADNDPVQFLRYLIAAFQQQLAGFGQTILDMLRSPQLPPTQTLVIALINEIAAAETPLVLVFDDYHFVTVEPVHALVQFLIEHQPPSLHVVIITREDPPLPLPRLRARGQLTEIRERDLRFTVDEATQFLNETIGFTVPAEAIAALESRTEGWIAGLQLAALALQKTPDQLEAFIAGFSGDSRYVIDYLGTEILEQQPAHIRDFLRKTAVLDRLTAPLCDALTGRQDGRQVLNHLEGSNLFLIPLDQRGEWYRYHSFFGEFLRGISDTSEQVALHQRAAQWYERNGYATRAIRHALAFGALTEDYSDAVRLVRQEAENMLREGAIVTVNGWLDSLPEPAMRADGQLAAYKGWVLALVGAMDHAKDYLSIASSCRGLSEERSGGEGRFLTIAAFVACFGDHDYGAAIRSAADALAMLDDSQTHWRIIALWVMAEAQERTRPISAAIATFREARRLGLACGNHFFAVMVEVTLVLSLNHHGQRRAALEVCEGGIARYVQAMGQSSPWATLLFGRLGMLYYESNQLELSRQYHERGMQFKEQFALEFYISLARGLSAPTLYAQGETSAALAALQEAIQYTAHSGYVDVRFFRAWEANFHLWQGDLSFAVHWAETAGLSPDDGPDYLQLEPHLSYARVLLAQDRLADARRWLVRLEQFARERELHRFLISVQVLQALCAERSDEHRAALDYLSEAVRNAAPQDYSRALLDEGAQVVPLLAEIRTVAPPFVSRVLGYTQAAAYQRPRPVQALIEPLSDRELEVLQLIAAGYSNQEIARELIIAVGTVKRHINHIYGKLDVHSRTQAVAKAKALELL